MAAKFDVLWCSSYILTTQLLLSISHAATGTEVISPTAPQLRSSVDGYKTACSNEVVYLTCSATGPWSLTWTSPAYIGERTAIEFNQDHDRPGDGKLVSLATGRATLAQISKTETSLSSDLKIIIANRVDRTNVTCTNDDLEYVSKSFNLARDPPSPPANRLYKHIAETSKNSIKVYRFRWAQPDNIDRIDLDYYEFQARNQQLLTLTNQSTELVLVLETDVLEHVTIVAVDRCGQRSQPATFRLGDVSLRARSQVALNGVTEENQDTNVPQLDNNLMYYSSSKRLDVLCSFILLMALSVLLLQ